MDKFLAANSPEVTAYQKLTQAEFEPDLDEALVADFASYKAFERYLDGKDLFILPRTRSELESILRRYSYDAIHNFIARSRSTLPTGGYSRLCNYAERSIRAVLNTGDNASVLVDLHCCPSNSVEHALGRCNARFIKTK